MVTFATIWCGSGRRSNTTLLPFFVRNQSRYQRAWRLCCSEIGSFCGQHLVMSDWWGVRGFGRAFCCGRDGLLLRWDPCWSRPAWLLVMQTLGAPDLVRVLLWGFLQASIPCSTAPLAGAATWFGAGGEVGASDRMVAKNLSFRGRVLRCPHNDPSGTKDP